MMSLIFLGYAVGHLALFVWALVLLVRYRQPATVPLLIVTFGLVYDNFIIAAGSTIGHGPLLERLSVPRFFMHAFGTPLLMLAAVGIARRAGVAFARKDLVAAGVGMLTVAMIAVGAKTDFIDLDLAAKTVEGIASYGNAAQHGPPVAPIVTILVLIAAGVAVWKKAGAWLLLGSVIQFAAAAIGDALVFAGNLGELALLAGMVATDDRLSKAATSTR